MSLVTDKVVDPRAALRRWSAGVFLNQRLRPVLITAAAGLVIFTCFRAGLLLVRLGSVNGLSGSQLAGCFLTGLRYDAMPIGYALLPLVLVLFLVPDSVLDRVRFRKGVALYATALTALAATVEVIGAAFFMHFGRRLDWMAINYPKHVREIGLYIWRSYPVLLIAPGIVLVFYGSYRFFRWGFWGGSSRRAGPLPRLIQGVILTALSVLACRGSLGNRPLRFGASFISNNNLINQLTMNNFFTFFHAVKSNINNGREQPRLYPFPPTQQAQNVTADMLFQPQDQPLGSTSNPFWRRRQPPPNQQDWNVVIIVMEGMAGSPVGALGYGDTHTPQLDALSREGIFFDRMYATGSRTSRAMIAVLCGHPDLAGISVLEQQQAQGKFLTFPGILRARGYRTMFIYGGDPDFDNMKGFFKKGGIQEVLGEKEMHAEGLSGNWGVPDEVVFRKAHERFLKIGSEPFFAAILTVSNHRPYEVPPGSFQIPPDADEDTKRLNAYRYADWALGEFFRMAREGEYFQRTIFVLVADHGHNMDSTRIIDVPGYRIPCVFYAPGIIPPRTISVVASQTDIPPTLLSLLGGSYEHCFMGRNLLEVQDRDGFALLHAGGSVAFVRSDRAVVLPPDQPKAILFRTTPFSMEVLAHGGTDEKQRHDLQLQMLAYFKMAHHLYMINAYRRPDDTKTALHISPTVPGGS